MAHYDFKKPIQQSTNFDEFVKQTEANLRSKIYQTEVKPNNPASNPYLWSIIFVLMLGIVGLGTYTLIQKQQADQELARYQTQGVAGVNETEGVSNVITAEGFTMMMDQPTPEQFKLNRSSVTFDYLPGKEAVLTSLLAEVNQNNQKVTSGVEVWVSEYDNKLDRKAFDQEVLKKLGQDYQIVSEDILLPKGFKLSEFKSESNPSTLYFTTVTSRNYYVIKQYNQANDYSELARISRFNDAILPGLYLN